MGHADGLMDTGGSSGSDEVRIWWKSERGRSIFAFRPSLSIFFSFFLFRSHQNQAREFQFLSSSVSLFAFRNVVALTFPALFSPSENTKRHSQRRGGGGSKREALGILMRCVFFVFDLISELRGFSLEASTLGGRKKNQKNSAGPNGKREKKKKKRPNSVLCFIFLDPRPRRHVPF